MQMLEKGHHGVKLDADALACLNTWIDLNVPYHATWLEERNHDARTLQQAEDTVKYKKLYAGIDDDIEWMPAPLPRPEFIEPASIKRQAELISLKGWPMSPSEVAKTGTETRAVLIGSKLIQFIKVPAGRFVMGSVTGAMDEAPQNVVGIEKPFWMSVKEITNAEFRAFNPKHDSGAIDQQWKDHIFPG